MRQIIDKIILLLTPIYGEREASLMAKFLIADLFDGKISDQDLPKLDDAVYRLLNNEPLQYVTEKAHFFGHCFHVNNHVLIPRPETEELVAMAIKIIGKYNFSQILDVGTGSGCIPISLAIHLPHLKVSACDISVHALDVAKYNAHQSGVLIHFFNMDFLNEATWQDTGSYELIVSNPPYISHSQSATMNDNVLKYEPHLALFAGEDEMVFYKALAKFGRQKHAMVLCEINEKFGLESAECFYKENFSRVEVVRDLQGKERILYASL